MRQWLALALAVLCSLPLKVATAAVVFSDTEFLNSDWIGTLLGSSGPAEFSAQRFATGGNPDAYRQLRHTFGGPEAGDFIQTGHRNNAAVYNPATQGVISEVDFAFDLRLFDGGQSGAVAYGAMLEQGGSFYIAGFELTLANAWTSHVIANLNAADFGKISGSGPSDPDFSSGGGAITFGYYASNGTAFGATSTLSGLDNWVVTVNQAQNGVPAPGTLALLGIALLGLGCCRRKHLGL